MYLSEVNETEISNKIKILKIEKVKGSNNLPVKLIKELRPIIIKPTTYA